MKETNKEGDRVETGESRTKCLEVEAAITCVKSHAEVKYNECRGKKGRARCNYIYCHFGQVAKKGDNMKVSVKS